MLHDWGVRSTIIVFGSSRTPSPETAEILAAAARTDAERAEVKARSNTRSPTIRRRASSAASPPSAAAPSRPHHHQRDNVIATGGGPGIMEAANRGAFEIGAPTIGFNITLPNEQQPNPYTTPELTFRFHYFAIRKMHLAMRARALVVFPGGFGTLDELFEILTLQQTGKAPRTPVVLYDKAYWTRIISFEGLVREGVVEAEDLSLFAFAETPEDVWARLVAPGCWWEPPARPRASAMFSDPLTEKLTGFVRDVGLDVRPAALAADTFLPGLQIRDGAILVDEARLCPSGRSAA